jgi:hypothetical protein
MRQTCGASPLQRAQGKGHHGDQIIQVPLFCTDKGRFTASPDRAATVPVLAAVRQAKRTKERLAAGLQQNRFSEVRLRLCGVSRDKLITDHAGGGLSIVADFKTEKAHSEKRLWVYDIRSKLGQDALCGSEQFS